MSLQGMRLGSRAAASAPAASEIPSTEQLRAELGRVEERSRKQRMLGLAFGGVVVVVAVAAVLATMFFPVLRIFGSSMEPTLTEGDYVVCSRSAGYEQGDLVAFYYNNKLLVKRVIALPGQQVHITAEGDVYVDGHLLHETYVREKALGDCDLEFPYQVPEGRYFVMGDHRATSTDSRNSMLGCVSDDNAVGRLVATVWPPEHVGLCGRGGAIA